MRLIDLFVIRGKLVAWLFSEKNIFAEVSFNPQIFVLASARSLEALKAHLESRELKCEYQMRRTLKGYKRVLCVQTTISSHMKIVRMIERFGNYLFEIFNSDIPLPEYCMFMNSVFPGCKISVEGDGVIALMRPLDEPFDQYCLPSLKSCTLSAIHAHPLRMKSRPELSGIELDGFLFEGEDFIKDFIAQFEKTDPDIIMTSDGSVEIPFLLDEIRKVIPGFSFSRFGEDKFEVSGNSYFSYGRTIYKHSGVYLKGRLHMEHKGVLYGKWSLAYPFELGRICFTPLQKINHRSAGFGVTNLQLFHAVRKGILIPQKTSCAERWKSGTELFEADRGSLVYEPVVGFHTDVAEIDFISLFPSIMVKKNISTETLFCSCCPNNKVPGLDINICENEIGIIPKSLAPIIKQRLAYKNSSHNNLKERADALKGLLVTSFGYMGFRKSKFARIESHQAIQAYARETLLEASKVCEENGFEVVHGIVDSLWIKKKGITKKECLELISKIQKRTGFHSKLEGLYRWVVFIPSTQNKNVPVPTRYYGVFLDGEIKCRGIDLRRHDTPRIISSLQFAIIKELSSATNYLEFSQLMLKSMVHIHDTISRILSDCDEREFIITKTVSKAKYKSGIAQSVISKKLVGKGYSLNPGQYISYVISDRNAKIPSMRYSLPGEADFDRYEYARLAKKAASLLFSPFIDISIEEKQPKLWEVLNDDKGVKSKELPLQVKEKAF